jgi:D-beta-D-heptose 7-phosphate kinase/D-beta-D-heptose 1-phosphate adenosyltransferase
VNAPENGTVDWRHLVHGFSGQRVLLVGDVIVDVYVYGTAIGKSAETPTIVAREGETKWFLGGAFLVARNVLELGAQLDFVTLVGDDEASQFVRAFRHQGYTGFLIEDAGRRTTLKKRFWVDGYKLLQLNTLDNRDLSPELTERVLGVLTERVERCDIVVVSDYRHGFLTPTLARGVVDLCAKKGKTLYVDSQQSQSAANHKEYSGANVFVLNEKEAQAILPDAMVDDGSIAKLETLATTLRAEGVVIKRGAAGALALLGGRRWRSEAAKVTAVDTCGAGDAFLAALCLAGIDDPDTALAMANRWAGFSTLIHGTDPPQLAEFLTSSGG